MDHVTCPHEDVLVITTEIDGYDEKRVPIDSGSSTNVLFLDAMKNMGKREKDLQKVNFPLLGFASTPTYLVGAIALPVLLGDGWMSLAISVTFIVVDTPAAYNEIFG